MFSLGYKKSHRKFLFQNLDQFWTNIQSLGIPNQQKQLIKIYIEKAVLFKKLFNLETRIPNFPNNLKFFHKVVKGSKNTQNIFKNVSKKSSLI